MTNFNSKETYLAARAEWKANYARLTVEAREARAAYNQAQSVFSKTSSYNNHAGYWAAHKEVQATLSTRESIKREANEALQELVEMKAEASRQWEASKLQPAQ